MLFHYVLKGYFETLSKYIVLCMGGSTGQSMFSKGVMKIKHGRLHTSSMNNTAKLNSFKGGAKLPAVNNTPSITAYKMQ